MHPQLVRIVSIVRIDDLRRAARRHARSRPDDQRARVATRRSPRAALRLARVTARPS